MRVIFPPFALLLAAALAAFGHPGGNLSVSHYAKLQPTDTGVDILFALDLAEFPSFELLKSWNLAKDAPPDVLRAHAAAQVREWVADLAISESGTPLPPRIDATAFVVSDGAGNLPVIRITARLHVAASGGRVTFEDHTYPSRPGWREIVIQPGNGADVSSASKGAADMSQALTAYPRDPKVAPPQDSGGWFEWTIAKGPVSHQPVIESTAAEPPASAATAAVTPPVAPSGTGRRSDAISRLLRTENMSWSIIAALLGLAFWFGALHALEPGHGKTMVAAYLVGARGTPKHAVLLGSIVTFTHTISVFILGLATMFLSQYVMPGKISKVLGIISGVSIVWIGAILLWRRLHKLTHDHHHDHDHHHGHHTHTHDGHTHTHVPEGDIGVGSLIALGASGGLVPCPSALILLLSAISIGRVGLGMVLLLSFSLGLAIVLTATGLLVLYAKNLLSERKGPANAFFRYMPVISAAVIVVIGMVMTGYSLGLFPANRFIG
ncbi:MAG TPA: sulfite exporter TauE/SafE family protein [Bryobacteraceae bacterium]|nr:sulfite exporter TauE/SafE family protein [Bryobacteraceae bacterium]